MAGNSAPRSVADATRFTSNTPHAATKSTPPNATPKTPSQTRPPPRPLRRPAGAPAAGPNVTQETMEERVRRLRAAHLAAKQHDVSKMDKIIGSSRRFFDAAHKFTVMGLIGFSGLALLVTVYATADMMIYNRKRRNEFFAQQRQFKEDSLEAARLAYMTGSATPEQIALVEDATSKAKEAGIALPSLLSTPRAAVSGAETSIFPGESMTETSLEPETKKSGVTGWLFGGLKKEEQSTNDERWKSTPSTTSTTPSDVAENLRDKAKAAFDSERDNQRKGGPLDQLGVDKTTTTDAGKKKGWLW
ncbi:hypothetical protein GGR57DRAFT_464566 [Xylariaceae sp. FL1272]|nr:hypothetical protein GGR57DRAFT_464566 [Xylariaceae sp. FL1272]